MSRQIGRGFNGQRAGHVLSGAGSARLTVFLGLESALGAINIPRLRV